jgi:predicted DNA repair protein MutK
VAEADFMTQVLVLVGIALLMTVGVYGLVAAIVKLDDAGLWLSQAEGDGAALSFKRALGAAILRAAPWLMKALSVAGTAAMFLVGGGILTHGVPPLHHLIEGWAARVGDGAAALFAPLLPMLLNGLIGVIAGAFVLLVVNMVRRLLPPRAAAT